MPRSFLPLLLVAVMPLACTPDLPVDTEVLCVTELGGETCTKDGRYCIDFPDASVQRSTCVTVQITEIGPSCQHLTGLQVDPSDLTLPQPFTITMPVDPAVSTGHLQIVRMDGREVKLIGEENYDPGTMSISGTSRSFGTFWVIDGPDADGDGFGFPADCDDEDPTVYPGAQEFNNQVDDDCDGRTDDPEVVDDDGDGFVLANDCDDNTATIYPGATELCDAVDQDCDGQIDEDFDVDGDGWFDADVAACLATYSLVDCDDLNETVAPDQKEVCDGVDNDCNSEVDEYSDVDGDGWLSSDCPSSIAPLPDCNDIDPSLNHDDVDHDGWTSCNNDCDDMDLNVSPGSLEVCDGIDNNCNGETDEGFDNDGDGASACDSPPDCDDFDADLNTSDWDSDGWTSCQGDCDDLNGSINPGAAEIQGNEEDENCDGVSE